MTDSIFRIATRKSPLALWQANHVREALLARHPELRVELITMSTQGDKILDTPLAKVGGKGLFVKELEIGILEGRADIAVHSMKDVPVDFPDGLGLASVLPREDPRDVLISNRFVSVEALPQGARVGTSSLRRQCQLRARRPDLQIVDLRGNVNTRLARLDEGLYDAILLAAAGVKRMGWEQRITELLPPEQFIPAIGQGAIGIETRLDDRRVVGLVEELNDPQTAIRIRAERSLNAALQGGCQVPIAGYSEISHGVILLRALVGRPDGRRLVQGVISGKPEDAEELGRVLAEDLLSRGAGEILAAVYGDAGLTGEPVRAELHGVGVLVTRPLHQAETLCRLIESLGGRAVAIPVLEILEPADKRELQDCSDTLDSYDWAIFISANAVARALGHILGQRSWPRSVRIAVIGRQSAEQLSAYGLAANACPQQQFNSEALLELPEMQAVNGQRIAIFRGEGGREYLAEVLRARGAEVKYVTSYRRACPAAGAEDLSLHLQNGSLDVAQVNSVESLENLVEMTAEPDRVTLLKLPLIVASERVVPVATRLGFARTPRVAENATDQAVLGAIRAWKRGLDAAGPV